MNRTYFDFRRLGLAAILILTLGLRWAGVYEDELFYLNPDESPSVRAILAWRNGVDAWPGIYGTLPARIVDLVTPAGAPHYFLLLIGRLLSGLWELGTVILLLAWGRREARPTSALLVAALYGLSWYAIHNGRWFTPEAPLTFFFTLSVFAATAPNTRFPSSRAWASGLAAGVAFACKVSGAIALSAGLAASVIAALRAGSAHGTQTGWRLFANRAAWLVGGFSLAAASLFPEPFFSTAWRARFLQFPLDRVGDPTFPPSLQWVGSFPSDGLGQLLVWGLGPALSLALVLGWGRALHRSLLNATSAQAEWAVIAIWSLVCFLHPVHSMRYFLPILPLLIRRAVDGADTIAFRSKVAWRTLAIGGAFLWTLAFVPRPDTLHPRIAASRDLLLAYCGHQNLPLRVVETTWDEILPLRLPGSEGCLGRWGTPLIVEMNGEDSPEKTARLADALESAQLWILSSPRQWGTIGKLPSLFPESAAFYSDLLGCEGTSGLPQCYRLAKAPTVGRLGFRLARIYDRLPRLAFGPWSVSWNDGRAEEAFWVYDRPRVMIFERQP